jgi:hypothetical protein
MTDETTVAPDATTDTSAPSNVNISIEQICAAILTTVTSVEVPLENLLANYGGKVIAINQDDVTKAVTFALADAPEPQDLPANDAETAE